MSKEKEALKHQTTRGKEGRENLGFIVEQRGKERDGGERQIHEDAGIPESVKDSANLCRTRKGGITKRKAENVGLLLKGRWKQHRGEGDPTPWLP